MGFLSKKSMLVSLLALSLAACASTRTIQPTNTVELACDGDAGSHDVAKTITFKMKAGSACDLQEVDFTHDPHSNYTHFKKRPPATGANPPVVFDYTESSPPLGDGAYFYYVTKSTNSPNPDGGGGGIIK